jgi:hypothetical protein
MCLNPSGNQVEPFSLKLQQASQHSKHGTLGLQGSFHDFFAEAALPRPVCLLEPALRVKEEVVQRPELLEVDRARIIAIMYSAGTKRNKCIAPERQHSKSSTEDNG